MALNFGGDSELTVSIPQAVSAVATDSKLGDAGLIIMVSIPQAVSAVATRNRCSFTRLSLGEFQYRKR